MTMRGGIGDRNEVLDRGRLTLRCQITAGHAVVETAGPLDCATEQQAYRYLAEVIDRYGLPVIVKVSGLTSCDSYGVLALARAAERAGLSGCAFWLNGRARPVMRIMRISGSGRVRLRWLGVCALAWTDPSSVVARLSSLDWLPSRP
jgi:anti-anti-sigma factor